MRTLSYPFLSSPLLSVLALFHAMNLVACQAASTSSSAACTSSSISADCAAQSGKTLTLTSRRPLAIKAGAKVALKGTGFSEAMTATVGGIPATSLRVSSATSASLVVPAGVTPGMADLKLSLSGSEVTASMAYMPTGGIPLITLAVSEVCSGVEYYDINGDRQTGTKSCSSSSSGSGSSSPNPWDLRAGVTVGGVTGKLKVNCRNAVRLSGTSGVFDNTTSPAAAGSDIWDTVDDYYGLPASTDFPVAWSVPNNYCGGIEVTAGDDNVWKDVTTSDGTTASTCTETSANCTMQDKISGLKWSNSYRNSGDQYTMDWGSAVGYCNDSTYNGQSAGSWRLPTQKELMNAFEHGIVSTAINDNVSPHYWMTLANMRNNFWSASSNSDNLGTAFTVDLSTANTVANDKNNRYINVVCVQ